MRAVRTPGDPQQQYDETCEACGLDATRCKCPACSVCGAQGDPKCADPGHCEICGQLKSNTGPRERTCGRDDCLARAYPR
jgi:hypothetical protein